MKIAVYDKQTNDRVAIYENSYVSDQPEDERKDKTPEYFEITYDGDRTRYYSYDKYEWSAIPEQVVLDDAIDRLRTSVHLAKWVNDDFTDAIRVSDLVAVLDEITYLRRKLKELKGED